MYSLFIILFILQFIFNLIFLIKSIKTKNNKNWLTLFSINISSLISIILIIGYSIFSSYLSWNAFIYVVLCIIALFTNILSLIINSIFKIIEIIKNKKENIVVEKLDTNTKRKAIIIPLISTILITIIICGVDNSKYFLQLTEETNIYNNVRSKEISKMANFLNEKYDMNIQESDCIYYREQDYTKHSDIFGNDAIYYNIPYIAVFKRSNEKITVVDRKGFISDNRQLKELNNILANYYYQKTGIKFDFIGFNKTYVGKSMGNDNIINKILQTKFNGLITEQNAEEFINCILQEEDLSITFYIKDNNMEYLKPYITEKLDYLKSYTNVEDVKVYTYNGKLEISYKEIEFPNEHKYYGNSNEDYYDSYKFGCYYVDANSSDLICLLNMDF